MGVSIFKHDGILGGIFLGFMGDPYRITLELSRNPNVIILASLQNVYLQKKHADSFHELHSLIEKNLEETSI